MNEIRQKVEEINEAPDPLTVFSVIKDRPYSFFLDSACDSAKLGNFSFIGHSPFLVFRSKGKLITLEDDSGKKEIFRADPFATLKGLFDRYRTARPDGCEVPFTGGAVGYFSYDLKDLIEELPSSAEDDLGIPDCILGFYNKVIAYDNLKKRCFLASLAMADEDTEDLKEAVLSASPPVKIPMPCSHIRLESNFTKRAYMKAVQKAKEYIKKGDIYQVNLSQRFSTTSDVDTFALYCRLRQVSPAPFASYLNFGDVTVLSSSPERFIMKRKDYIETRPIKGTRPRGATIEEDRLFESQLRTSVKDAAEHIMIVDLERNDLGRICEYGTVRPTESMIIEKYANVFHLVSTVAG
ncbi:MAG: anthranilate synthase component I family protein, partial [Candidatus Omnitrophica bacterium]|nr:anthranilate synthase component I family protein [Candidatus Omnitrophota bacterium]